jgi:plastocyanin
MRALRPLLAASALMLAALGSVASAAQTVAIDITGFRFMPETMTITAGDTVTWTNRDSAQHSVLFLTGLGQTPNFGLGQSASLRFVTPGTFNYICGLHGQSMSGSVVVRAADGPIAAVTGGAPTFVPPTATPEGQGLVVRAGDAPPVLPDLVPFSSDDGGRPFVLGGIGLLVLYLGVRTRSLLRRR